MRKFKFNLGGENLMENFVGGKIMERIVNLNKKASESPLGGGVFPKDNMQEDIYNRCGGADAADGYAACGVGCWNR